jgi:hypothetical protein
VGVLKPPPHGLVLTRFVVLRLLGALYFVAFLVLAEQAVPLFGSHGLTPADSFMALVAKKLGGAGAGFWRVPSLFWLGISDDLMSALAWVGAVLGLAAAAGFTNGIALFVMWALYLSFIHVGQVWYGFGWEMQLCETGFLAVFLAPLLDPRPLAARAPPRVVVWLFRWLAVRILLGAGLIKIRGDACWRDLTCLDWHFETQPLPNPLSPLYHFAPHWVHAAGVLFNYAAELVAPLFVFTTRRLRHVAAAIMLAFQLTLISSGNLSFLNWLTIVPILACFDDGVWRRILPRRLRVEPPPPPGRPATVAAWILAAGVAILSLNVVDNLFSSRQKMNASFDPFDLVNTYGAFGSVGKERDEIVFEGSRDGASWIAYEFKCKPGDPDRAPCIVAPYQLHLDWQIWFAAMGQPGDEPWTLHFVWKLLHNDRDTLSLLANDPFPDAPPRFIRATLFRYEFAPIGAHGWWRRTEIGPWLPALSTDDPELLRFLAAYGWR